MSDLINENLKPANILSNEKLPLASKNVKDLISSVSEREFSTNLPESLKIALSDSSKINKLSSHGDCYGLDITSYLLFPETRNRDIKIVISQDKDNFLKYAFMTKSCQPYSTAPAIVLTKSNVNDVDKILSGELGGLSQTVLKSLEYSLSNQTVQNYVNSTKELYNDFVEIMSSEKFVNSLKQILSGKMKISEQDVRPARMK